MGEVVESKGEKVKKEEPKKDTKKPIGSVDADDKKISVKDEIIDAAIAKGKDSKKKKDDEEEEEKDIDEKLAEKIKEKTDPKEKIKSVIEKKTEKAKDELIDSILKGDDEAFAAEKAAKAAATTPPTPSAKGAAAATKIVDAGGKTSTTTPTAAKVLAADATEDIFKMAPSKAVKTIGSDIVAMSKSVAKGFKDSKNLRLAATAALLSATGYGFGKITNRNKKPNKQLAGPDESEAIRRQLLEDG